MTKEYKYLLQILILAFVIFIITYILKQNEPDVGYSFDEKQRGLNGIFKKILNGHLGYLFNYKYVGLVGILLVSSLAVFWFGKEIKSNKHIYSLLLFSFPLAIFISYVAYFNYRYLTTMVPIFIFLLILIVEQINDLKFKRLLLTIFLLLQFSFYCSSMIIEFLPRYSDRLFKVTIDGGKKQNVVEDVYEYINQNIAKSDTIIVNNLPQYYLKCENYGIYYWSGDELFFNEKGEQKINKLLSIEDRYKFFTKTLNGKYFLQHEQLKDYNDSISFMLKKFAHVVARKQKGEILYQLK